MRIARATVAGILLASVLALGGCKKKKPAVPPPQAQAPSVTQPEPEVQPPVPPASEPNRPQPEPAQPETAPAATATPAPKPKTKPRPAKKTVPPPAPEKPAEKAENQPTKTVVPEGSTQPATPQLSPTMPTDQKIHQKMNTNQLLEATDYNLKGISRTLNTDEQAMLQHIRSYMQQARDAAKDGDTERAYNLALKAHLLSDELIKH
jgi:outer membrane biosynthesis protein TonB